MALIDIDTSMSKRDEKTVVLMAFVTTADAGPGAVVPLRCKDCGRILTRKRSITNAIHGIAHAAFNVDSISQVCISRSLADDDAAGIVTAKGKSDIGR